MRGLYIHIPFCKRKCAYCDFYSVPERLELIETYIDAVVTESRSYTGLSGDTLYLGGGTPSLLGAAGLKKLLDGLRHNLDMSRLVEATIEVNPESTTSELLFMAKSLGIDRVSIGVQSLTEGELQSVGRLHTMAQALAAIKRAQEAGFPHISADVIVGLPGQDWQTLHTTLETLVNLGITHLSVYCLSLEEGTPLALAPPGDLPSDDMQASLFHQAKLFLQGSGFDHYEISNFACRGYQCQHNLNYWRGGEYLGLGPAAASHLDGKRFKNAPNLDAYLKNPGAIKTDVEELCATEKAAEEAMLRLRLLEEGVSADELIRRFGGQSSAPVLKRLDRLVTQGLITKEDSKYRLPPEQVLTSNPVFARVLGD